MKVVVIGGGAAGLMAAGFSAKSNHEVTLIEKNKIFGKKLNITGKGRCNITNQMPADEFMKNIPRNPKFLLSALSRFTPEDTIRFFEENGLPIKVERGHRVFPQSDVARDVTDTLIHFAKSNRVTFVNGNVSKILTENGMVKGVQTDKGVFAAEKVILATGGLSYPLCGSTGDGYRMAQELGHTVTELTASLVPLVANCSRLRDLQGLTLKNVTLSAFDGGKKIFEELGEMLFTHFGISGPLVLSLSAHIGQSKPEVRIDLKPGLESKKLDARILRDFEERKNQEIKNAIRGLVPEKLVLAVLEKADISPGQKVNELPKAKREALCNTLKAFPIEIIEKRPIEEAVITSGGISVKEINPKTMESKIVKGLYFAGEIIDVDGYTGGFNLQIAWSTAYVAGWQEESI